MSNLPTDQQKDTPVPLPKDLTKYYSKEQRKLDLSGYCDGWKQIIKSKDDWSLEKIYIQGKNLNDSDLVWILSCNLGKFTVFDIYNNQVTDDGIKILAASNLHALKILELNKNQISSKSIKYLVKANFPVLQKIFLGWDKIGDEGATHLNKSNWPCLNQIALGIDIIIL